MFKENTNTFPIIGEYKSAGSRIFKFITPDDKIFLAYFTPTNGYIEVLFDSKSYPGFDKFTADGYTIEKLNTIAQLMINYEKKYGNQMKGFWWQATRQRFMFYKKYFQENSNMLTTFNSYQDMWSDQNGYGYSCLTREGDTIDESIIRFLM